MEQSIGNVSDAPNAPPPGHPSSSPTPLRSNLYPEIFWGSEGVEIIILFLFIALSYISVSLNNIMSSFCLFVLYIYMEICFLQ